MSNIERGGNVAIAFGLVLGSALSTGIGASAVFFPSVVKIASTRVLAASLGFSAGVMLYVSFMEIISKSAHSFEEAGYSHGDSNLYSTICFFCGMLLMVITNKMVHILKRSDDITKEGFEGLDDPKAKLHNWHMKAENELSNGSNQDPEVSVSPIDKAIESGTTSSTDDSQDIKDMIEKDRLIHMGASTAIAIAVHNFPDGLVTFVSALDDPHVGAVLAIAIAIHNIPEGLCVALPVYYATGNRVKAFSWGLLSGLSEPIGALIGWLILARVMRDEAYAALFGLVAGMMTYISLSGLIPAAFRYDTKDTIVTPATVLGMIVMAVSLVMLSQSGHEH